VLFSAFLLFSLFSCTATGGDKTASDKAAKENAAEETGPADRIVAAIETDKGVINLRLFDKKVPYTVANFVNLANRGYYNGLNFHRVLDNFMIQGGCPSGNGRGGPGYKFADEFDSTLKHDRPGILSMANAGRNTNGSQFFITHVPTQWLNRKQAVFGSVLGKSDMDVVNSIRQGDAIIKVTITGDISDLMASTRDKTDEWNRILDAKFPDLKKLSYQE